MVIFAALAAAVAGDALARGVGRGEPVRLVPVAASRTAPLPRPRPVAAPEDRPRASDRDASPGTAAERAPSACRQTLTEDVAIAPSIAPIRGPGACGGEDLVRLEAVVLSDKRRIAVRPAAVLRCTMASALAAWIRSDIAPLADSRAMRIAALDNFDSFDCRGRNRVATAKLSEHGRANALDLRGLKLANGRLMALTDRNTAREVREKVRASACARFMTVLGPGSDGYHENHIHLDLAERRSGYRICHWDIERAPGGQAETATSTQPMPPPRAAAAARPLPVARPEQAPSRGRASQDGVEQMKVQPARPPAFSLSPVPLARQPADIARPIGRRDAGRRQTVTGPKPATTARPKTATDKQTATATEARPNAKTGGVQAKGNRGRRVSPKSSGAGSQASVTDARRPKRRHGRSRGHQRPPGLPQLLKRMFD